MNNNTIGVSEHSALNFVKTVYGKMVLSCIPVEATGNEKRELCIGGFTNGIGTRMNFEVIKIAKIEQLVSEDGKKRCCAVTMVDGTVYKVWGDCKELTALWQQGIHYNNLMMEQRYTLQHPKGYWRNYLGWAVAAVVTIISVSVISTLVVR